LEEKDLELFNASMKQWQANQITPQKYADILEKQILPQWRAEREAIEKLKVSQDQAATKRLLVEYLTNREQGWQLTVDGLRAHDADKLRQGERKEAEAEKVAAQLRSR
jgi:hypothetical protein